MNHITEYNEFLSKKGANDTQVNEEWKLPTFQNIIKRKLSFLKDEDLSQYEPPATHQSDIKKLWEKVIKKMYSGDEAKKYIDIVNNYDVHKLTNTLNVIKQIQKSLKEDTGVGQIVYLPSTDKIDYYDKPIDTNF